MQPHKADRNNHFNPGLEQDEDYSAVTAVLAFNKDACPDVGDTEVGAQDEEHRVEGRVEQGQVEQEK